MNKENNYIDDIDQMTNEVYVGDEDSAQEYADDADDKESAYQEVKDVIRQTAREDEKPASSSFTLRQILGGDILSTQFLRQQIWLILLIALFTIIYVGNRYSCQKKMLTINHLNKEVVEQRYKMLSLSSDLTERCRETQVLQELRENNDTTLHIADQPPFIIEIPEE
jgi:hypothetical protein